jgi:predicted aldo/keto reductase-like oxidoreductase
MQYREMGKTDDKVSILGYGCIRFPKKNGKIDEEYTEKLIINAIEHGVNYFDTAYAYPGSEAVLGKILAKGYREKVFIATKMPIFFVHTYKDMENSLETSLKRLQTDHIDYYLLHNINSFVGWQRLKDLGICDFLRQKQKEGAINKIGFSYHGEEKQFEKIIDDYTWDFCQIQYNYLDENTQAGKKGLEYAASKGLGVVIMEPLRGGLLAQRLPEKAQAIFNQYDDGKKTPAEWALHWVWNHPQVTLLLSGMNEDSQVEENLQIADMALPQ